MKTNRYIFGLLAIVATSFCSQQQLSAAKHDAKKRHSNSSSSHSKNHKDKCPKAALKLNVEDGGTAGYSLQTDDKGMYTVTADNIYEAFKGVGYCNATDRMWQIFTFWAQATGNLSTYFGATSDNISSDVFFRSIAPTDAQIDAQLPGLLPKPANLVYGTLAGINKRIDEVNASGGTLLPLEVLTIYGPSFTIPNISVYDYQKMVIAIATQLSPTVLGALNQPLQLLDLVDLSQNYPDPVNMFNDLYPPQPGSQAQIRVATKSSDACACQNVMNSTVRKVSSKNSAENPLSIDTSELKKKLNAVKDAQEDIRKALGIPKLGGSYGIVLSDKKTKTGDVVLFGAPQLDHTIPGALYPIQVQVTVGNKVAFDCQGATALGLFSPIFTCRNYDYSFSQTGQVPTVCGRDAVILDLTNDVYLSRTEYIANGTIAVPIYVSNDNTSYIYDTQTLNSGDFPYNQGIGMRSALTLGKEALSANFLEVLFARNFQEFYNATKNAVTTQELIAQNAVFGDSQGNIGDYITSSWTQLPPSINRQLPQTTFAPFLALGLNPYPPKSDLVVRTNLQDFNTPDGYYSNWNQNYANCLESIDYSTATVNYNRGLVVDERLKEFAPQGRLDKKDYIDFMISLANSEALSNGINSGSSSGNSLTDGWMVYVPLILDAIDASPSTPERAAAKTILQDYYGNFIYPSNRDTILDSPTVSEGYMRDIVKCCVSKKDCTLISS